MKLDVHIRKLLWSHDCVILPDFGGLIANPRHAAIVPMQNRILPPGKQLSFNRVLTTNDGLLIDIVRRDMNVSYEQARDEIEKELALWKARLTEGRSIRIEEIGRFFMNAQGSILFEPSAESHFSLDAFGFAPVHLPQPRQQVQPVRAVKEETPVVLPAETTEVLKPVRKLTPVSKEVPVEQSIESPEEKIIPITRERKKRGIAEWKVAAALPLFIVVGAFLAWTMTRFTPTDHQTNFSRISVPETLHVAPTEKVTHSIEEQPIGEETTPEDKVIEQPDIQVTEMPAAPKGSEEMPDDIRFHLIGGCFSSRRNAEKKLEEMKAEGYDAVLAGKSNKGLYRVSYGGAHDRKDAERLRNKLRANKRSVWILEL
ncbi:MAG: SPOR domain-containing protein [Flavobacteriales bacterium]|nr:SPOR domain-containing protein [Flavobacteriales bacterium]